MNKPAEVNGLRKKIFERELKQQQQAVAKDIVFDVRTKAYELLQKQENLLWDSMYLSSNEIKEAKALVHKLRTALQAYDHKTLKALTNYWAF